MIRSARWGAILFTVLGFIGLSQLSLTRESLICLAVILLCACICACALAILNMLDTEDTK